jgi:hypothetical protein
LKNFIFFATEVNERKKRGELVELDDRLLDVWRMRLKKAELERKEATEKEIARQEQLQKDFLNTKLATTKFSQKMYDVAMTKPELWREIKQKEYDQLVKEQEKLKAEESVYQEKTVIQQEFEELQNRIQNEFSEQIASKVLASQAIRLLEEKNAASLKIAKLMRKQQKPVRGEMLNQELGGARNDQNFIRELEKMLDETVSEGPLIQGTRQNRNQLHFIKEDPDESSRKSKAGDFDLSGLQGKMVNFNREEAERMRGETDDPIVAQFDSRFEKIIGGLEQKMNGGDARRGGKPLLANGMAQSQPNLQLPQFDEKPKGPRKKSKPKGPAKKDLVLS